MSDLRRLLGLEGSLHIDVLNSPALAGNPLGDPTDRLLGVYTPPGYDPGGSRRYPVLYCLHGYTGDLGALIATRPWETNVVQWLDRLNHAPRDAGGHPGRGRRQQRAWAARSISIRCITGRTRRTSFVT